MPRQNNSRSFTSPKSPAAIPQMPTISHQPQQERPGFFSNMWTGFGLGTGQAIAHNMFRSDPIVKHIHASAPKEYDQCMKDNNNDKELCEHFLKK
jgi:hypothetical protein